MLTSLALDKNKFPRTDKQTLQKKTIPTFPPPPTRQEISQLLPKREQFRQERLQMKEEKEKAFELQGLCYKYLKEKDKDRAKDLERKEQPDPFIIWCNKAITHLLLRSLLIRCIWPFNVSKGRPKTRQKAIT